MGEVRFSEAHRGESDRCGIRGEERVASLTVLPVVPDTAINVPALTGAPHFKLPAHRQTACVHSWLQNHPCPCCDFPGSVCHRGDGGCGCPGGCSVTAPAQPGRTPPARAATGTERIPETSLQISQRSGPGQSPAGHSISRGPGRGGTNGEAGGAEGVVPGRASASEPRGGLDTGGLHRVLPW